MNRKHKPKIAGLTLDGLITGLLVITTVTLFSASYLNQPVPPEIRARENAQIIASAAYTAKAHGNHRIKQAQNIAQVVDLISSGVTVTGSRDLGFATIRGPEMTSDERREAMKFLRFSQGEVEYSER